MKCSKCSKRNIRNANYCKFCGHKFTNEEKEKSKNSGLLGLLNRFQKWYNLCTLSVITDHIAFKIIVVLGVLAIGIYNVISIGSELKVLDSSYYEVQYNKKNDEI